MRQILRRYRPLPLSIFFFIHRPRFTPWLAGTILLLALIAAGFSHSNLIWAQSPDGLDTFDTDQPWLELIPPDDIGSSASSTASGAGILGTERDIRITLAGKANGSRLKSEVNEGQFSIASGPSIEGSAHIEWDGPDGDATVLNPTGLGGIDLTAGGRNDAIVLEVSFDDNPIDFVLTAYSDESKSSTLAAELPGRILTSTVDFVIPFVSFVPDSGAGADFSDIGAIALDLTVVNAPDILIDSLNTTSVLEAAKTVDLLVDGDGNGEASPGDTVQYRVMLSNPDDGFDASAAGVVFNDILDLNTTLVISSVTTTQGSISSGNNAADTAVTVEVGTIADGATVTIQFEAMINMSLPAGVTEITNQGSISSDSLVNLPTDDPDTDTIDDPTILPLVPAPAIYAAKTVSLLDEGDAQLGPGDVLTYTVTITNNGNETATQAIFNDILDPNTALTVGSVTTTQGTITSGNNPGDTAIQIELGSIAGGGDSVTISFRATIDDPLPPDITQVANQGTVSGENFTAVSTDDPDTSAPDDPTISP